MAEPDEPGGDKRVHARVSVSVPIQVNGAEGSCRAMLTDLSRGGARFVAHKPVGGPGDRLELFLPCAGGIEIGIVGEITRVGKSERGELVGMRFAAVDAGARRSLDDLLDVLLASPGGGRRRHPRVAHRVELPNNHYRAVLEDVSRGGLSMTVSDPVGLDEDVVVVIPDTHGEDLLTMRGRVVSARSLGGQQKRIGLTFGDLAPERRRCLDALLDALAKR